MNLLEMRNNIDKIDEELIELFQKRLLISEQVAKYKIENGIRVFDKERENRKIESVRASADNQFNQLGLAELFTQIMAISRKLQYQLMIEKGVAEKIPFEEKKGLHHDKMKVVFQGVEGAYSQAAMIEYFGENINSYHVKTFRDAMEAIEKREADYAVLPIENTSAGIVNDMYDLLVDYDHSIVGEQVVKVDHVLVGLPNAELADIKKVYSHPQGLMQCKKFLEEHKDWQQVPSVNTAVAAKQVMEDQKKSHAAISSRAAARQYGLKILMDRPYYSDTNSTRFIVVAKEKIFLEDANKVSICFEVSHKSGELYYILSHFIYNGLNMSKIESRPIVGRNWEYRFFVDFAGNLNDSAVKNALHGIQEEALHLKILGNYVTQTI